VAGSDKLQDAGTSTGTIVIWGCARGCCMEIEMLESTGTLKAVNTKAVFSGG
jgi:hypothetical protein